MYKITKKNHPVFLHARHYISFAKQVTLKAISGLSAFVNIRKFVLPVITNS